jgi:hypothetical protein
MNWMDIIKAQNSRSFDLYTNHFEKVRIAFFYCLKIEMRTLILLENHLCSASRQYVADNIENFKTLGYKKFLLEMPKDMSINSLKQKFKDAVRTSQPGSPIYTSSNAFLNLLYALQKHQMPFEFIDSQKEMSLTETQRLFRLSIQKGQEALLAELRQTADRGDITIAHEIIQQAKEYSGGIIYLAGFEHKHLINLLKNENYCFTIFDNSKEPCSVGSNSETVQNWKKISNETFRKDYYKTNMHYFDLATNPSFELVQSACQLSTFKSCEQPSVGNYLSLTIKQNFFYTIDTNYVVSATTEIAQDKVEEVINNLKSNFPRLLFFTENNQTKLTIPGINLPENLETLKQGFIANNVMKL